MRKIVLYLFIISGAGIIFILSCKKEKSCEGCINGNKPPTAVAGPDQVITLPTDSISLDGTASSDPDGMISEWLWKKISGPASFNIVNAARAKTVIKNLNAGIYQFELKVTDAGGLFSNDTLHVYVNTPLPQNNSCPPTNRPFISTQLTPVGNLSIARYGMAAASAGNKLFFAGGNNASGSYARVDIYDIATQTWSEDELSMPRYQIASAVVGDKIFFAGGFAGGAVWSTRVDIYSLSTQTWSTAELSQARASIITATVGNKVFFAGGQIGQASTDITSTIDIYDVSANTWSIANLSETRIGFTATTAGDKIYFAGGYDGMPAGTVNSTKIDIYDNATGSWSVSNLSAPKAYHFGIFKNGKIYWGGGYYYDDSWSDGSETCTVEIKDVTTQSSTFANLFSPEAEGYGAFEKDNKIVFLKNYYFVSPWNFDIYDIASNSWSIGVVNPALTYSLGTVISANNSIYVAGGVSFSGGQSHAQVWKLEF